MRSLLGWFLMRVLWLLHSRITHVLFKEEVAVEASQRLELNGNM